MMPPSAPASKNRLLWLGPARAELAWLSGKLGLHCDVTHTESLDSLADQGPAQHIVIGCDSRSSFPNTEIDWIQKQLPEVPLAIALGVWWEGGRRTSQISTSAPLFNWHRLWEHWIPWLGQEQPALLAPCQPTYPRSDVGASDQATSTHKIQIVANQNDNALAIELLSDSLNPATKTIRCTAAGLANSKLQDRNWFVWDDSCWREEQALDRQALPTSFLQTLSSVQERNPNARHTLCWNSPDWQLLDCVEKSVPGASFLTKPFTLATLQRVLLHG